MTGKSKSELQISRERAGFTQEQAAPLLGCAPRTLSDYENRRESDPPIPDDVVYRARMAYRDKRLAYNYLIENNILAPEFLPKVEPMNMTRAALSLVAAAQKYINVQADLIDMAADGRIDMSEKAMAEAINHAVAGLKKAIFQWELAEQDEE